MSQLQLAARSSTGLFTKQEDETHSDYLFRTCCCLSFCIFLTMILFASMTLLWHFETKHTNYNSAYCKTQEHEIISCCTNGDNCYKPKKYIYKFDINATYCTDNNGNNNNTFIIFGDCVAEESDLGPPKYQINQTVKCYTINKDCNSFSLTDNKEQDKKTLDHWIQLLIISSSSFGVLWILMLLIHCKRKYFGMESVQNRPQNREDIIESLMKDENIKIQK